MKRHFPDRRAPTRDNSFSGCRVYGGHLARHHSSVIDGSRRDPRIAARLRELLADHHH